MSSLSPEDLAMVQAIQDRQEGPVLASAVGDALGLAYKTSGSIEAALASASPLLQCTNDMALAVSILLTLASQHDLTSEAGLDDLAHQWLKIYDIYYLQGLEMWRGMEVQSQNVLRDVGSIMEREGMREPVSRVMVQRACYEHETLGPRGHSGGNGCLKRLGPLVLGFVCRKPEALADAARKQTVLTHFDPDAGDAAVLWSLAVRQEMREGSYDLRAQLEYLPEDRRQLWAQRIAEAEEKGPEAFADKNHNAVAALQCAYIANRRGNDVRSVLENALRGGGDTAGVAAIAGQLAGARFGASSVPSEWRDKLWVSPGHRAGDLKHMNQLARYAASAYNDVW